MYLYSDATGHFQHLHSDLHLAVYVKSRVIGDVSIVDEHVRGVVDFDVQTRR